LQVKSAFTRAFNQQHVKPRTGFGMDDKVRCNSLLVYSLRTLLARAFSELQPASAWTTRCAAVDL